MKETGQPELVRVLELDYEKTTKLIEDIVSSSFTIRGWGIALISALIGFTFQAQLWEIAGTAIVVTLLIAFVDGYHSWLYARILRHAQNVECAGIVLCVSGAGRRRSGGPSELRSGDPSP